MTRFAIIIASIALTVPLASAWAAVPAPASTPAQAASLPSRAPDRTSPGLLTTNAASGDVESTNSAPPGAFAGTSAQRFPEAAANR